jgi:hypothetical protein
VSGAHRPGPIRAAAGRRAQPGRLAEIWGHARFVFAIGAAVTFIALACLVRIAQRGAISWVSPVVLPLLILCVACASLLAVQAFADGGRAQPRIVVLLVAAVLLLSTIGMLVRLSLGVSGAGEWSQPLIGALGILTLVTSIELAQRFQPGMPGFTALLVIAMVLVTVQFADRPGHASVSTGAPASWSTPPLIFFLLGLLAVALTARLPQLPERSARLLAWVRDRLGADLLRHLLPVLPVLIALALFAFTRNLGAAIGLLAGAVGVVAGAEQRVVTRPNVSPAGSPGHRLPRGPVSAIAIHFLAFAGRIIALLAIFLAGAWVLTIVGTSLFHDAGFRFGTVLAAGQPDPIALLNHHPLLIGPGFSYRRLGPAGAGQAILPVLGRETGFLGLLGTGLIFAGLLACLLRLAFRQEPRSFGSAWTFGLAGLVFGQVLVATLTLLRILPPFAPGAPLLAGGAPWYVATLIAIGIAVGCASRPSAVG